MKYYLILIFFIPLFSHSMDFSGSPSITKDQAERILKEHKFSKKELAYRDVFLKYETSLFDKVIDSVYDPKSTSTISSKEKIKEAIVDCNVYSYQAFNAELRDVPFDIAVKGGSYPDAKMAFDAALAIAADNKNMGIEHVLEMVQGAANIIKVCTDNHGIKIIP